MKVKIQKFVRTKNEIMMFLSKCSVCNSKKLKFLTEQEARGLIDWSKSTNCK